LRKGYDGGDISARLSAAEAGGLALTGMRYNAEFNFMARLTQKVATPATAEGLVAWAKAYPNGLIFGPNGSIDAPPEATERYNRIEYGFWPASALTSRE